MTLPPPPVAILGTGAYVPERVVRNAEIEVRLDLPRGWIASKTGIHERRFAAGGEATSDLAAHAARRALEAAGLEPGDVDLIVVATSSADHPIPSTASRVQARIGAANAAAFDVAAACSGFIYALSIVQAAMRGSDDIQKALVIGADTLSRFSDPSDRKTAVLFGDGAGAVVLGRGEGGAVLRTHLGSDGSCHDLVLVPAGGSRSPATAESAANDQHFLRMDGRGVRAFFAEHLPRAFAGALRGSALTLGDVDLLVLHQANGILLDEALDSARVPRSRAHFTVERYGNTGAASVPITLDDAVRSGRLVRGEHALLAAVGAGMTWASALLRW